MSNELGRSSVHAQTQTDPKAPGSAVGALAAMEEPKLREEHHGETVQCSFSLKKKKKSPHCMKDLDVIQILYQETGHVKSNYKLEYRLKNQTARSKLKRRQDYIF